MLINLKKMSSVCDWFVIASGASTTQTRAIADHVVEKLKEKGERIGRGRIEGEREASWILLDCSDVVVHVFLDQTRRFYDLENLWAEAPQERFKETKRKKKTPPGKKKKAKKKKKRF